MSPSPLKPVSIVALACLFFLFFGCSSSRITSGGKAKLKPKSKDFVLKRLEQNHLTFRDLSGKAKIRYDDGYQRMTFQANLRMQRDSFIWVSASVLSYEVARLLIKPDSIFLINRWEKTYLAESYSGFDSTFQIPVSFDQLQNIVIGNLLLEPSQPVLMDFSDGQYLIVQENGDYHTVHQINGASFRAEKIQVADTQSGYEVDAKFEDYQALKKSGFFPYFREYIIKNNNVHFANIQLNFTSLETKKTKRAPFEIPEHYTRAD